MLNRLKFWFAGLRKQSDTRDVVLSPEEGPDAVNRLQVSDAMKVAQGLVRSGEVERAKRLLEVSGRESQIAIHRAAANAMLADLLQGEGKHADARAVIDLALADAPDDSDLNYRAGVHSLAAGDAESALDYFRLARHYAPTIFFAYAGEAKALDALGRGAEIGKLLDGFLSQNPGHRAASLELAIWRYGRGEFEEAMLLLAPIAEGDPIHPEACNLLSLILGRDLGRVDDAICLLERALLARPGWTVALCNLGWMHSEAGRLERGLEILNEVIQSVPDDPEARLIRAYMNLKHGEFSAGWRDYDARHKSKMAVERPYRFPRWDGESAQNSSLLIVAEQGLGDHLMFASCVSEASLRVGRVFLECHPNLVGLFKRSFPSISVIANVPVDAEPSWLQRAGKIDFQIWMGDLPALFRNRWDQFPNHSGYLRADPDRVTNWRKRLDALGPGVKVGLSWRGGVRATRRQLRSFSPVNFAPLYRNGMQFISLQYGDVEEDLADMQSMGLEVVHWPEAIADYEETAALVCALDQVVSVCTAVIHLCGSLGCPALVLVPKVAEWRYLFDGDRLPWYPSVRLIRQRTIAEWREVIDEAGQHLR